MMFTLVYLTPPNDISKVKTRDYSEVLKLQDEFDNHGTIGWLTAPRVEGTLQPCPEYQEHPMRKTYSSWFPDIIRPISKLVRPISGVFRARLE